LLGQQELSAASEAAVTARMAYLISFIGCPLVGGSVERKISNPIFDRHARPEARRIKGKSVAGNGAAVRHAGGCIAGFAPYTTGPREGNARSEP
jgi:hypothetical protein